MSEPTDALVARLSSDMADMKAHMARLADAVTKLAVVEERQASAKESIERTLVELGKLSERVMALELAQPVHRQTSDWVRKAVGLLLAAVIGAGVSGVVRNQEPRAPVVTHDKQTTQ